MRKKAEDGVLVENGVFKSLLIRGSKQRHWRSLGQGQPVNGGA